MNWLPFQPKLLPNYSPDALNLGFFFAPYLLFKACEMLSLSLSLSLSRCLPLEL